MKILGQNAHWIINKDLAKDVGIEGALLLSDLIDKQEYFENKGEITEDGYFYNTIENIEKNTTLSNYKQKQALKILKEKGYIDYKLMGIPAKLHFKIFENKILNFLKTGFKKIGKQDFKKFETNNNKEIIIKNNNKEIILSKDKEQSSSNEKKQNKKENFNEKEKEKKIDLIPEKKEYGNQDINKIIEIIKKYNNGLCAGTQKEQRQYGNLLLKKLKKLVKKEFDIFQSLDILISKIIDNPYYSHKVVGPKEIYYNFEKLVNIVKSGIKKEQKTNVIEF